MRVQDLEIDRFRNISKLNLTCPEELHIFVGPNAQGKTNILESLYVLSLGKSHRSRSHQDLIQFGQISARLKARIKKNEQTHRLEVQLTEKGKKVSKNGVEKPRLSQYIGFLPAVLFAPEDLSIIKGGPQIRRRFLDTEIGQVSPTYVYSLTQLNKILQQRNRLLKNKGNGGFPQDFLEILNEQLITISVDIWRRRFQFLAQLTPWVQKIHESITHSQDELSLQYIPSLSRAEKVREEDLSQLFREELYKIRDLELRRGITLVGPHRDDFRMVVGGINLHVYGSQGQQRTAALSLKMAEIEIIKQEMGHYPILLLDDVMSELDDSRRSHLLHAIRGRVQTFVTTTSLEGIDENILHRARIYQVKQGTISELR